MQMLTDERVVVVTGSHDSVTTPPTFPSPPVNRAQPLAIYARRLWLARGVAQLRAYCGARGLTSPARTLDLDRLPGLLGVLSCSPRSAETPSRHRWCDRRRRAATRCELTKSGSDQEPPLVRRTTYRPAA